ncbi:MAG: transcriptional regulator [Mycobacterium sp.]|jgi:DNA-binding MarR family transcriptional regulator|nr:transcriptional regulator [Mycobacterium sp.]
MWLTAEQQRVWRNYLAVVSGLQRAMNRQLHADCGISLGDYDILVALSERGPMRVFELGETVSWEQSRLSHQLRRMRERGLIERHGSDDDRRGATVSLSAAGGTALRAAAPGHAELVRSVMFAGMTAEELQALDRWSSAALTSLTRRT